MRTNENLSLFGPNDEFRFRIRKSRRFNYVLYWMALLLSMIGKETFAQEADARFSYLGGIDFGNALPVDSTSDGVLAFSKFQVSDYTGYFLSKGGTEIRIVNLFSGNYDSLQLKRSVYDFLFLGDTLVALHASGLSFYFKSNKELKLLKTVPWPSSRVQSNSLDRFGNFVSAYSEIYDSSFVVNTKTFKSRSVKGKMIYENIFLSSGLASDNEVALMQYDTLGNSARKQFRIPFKILSIKPIGNFDDKMVLLFEKADAQRIKRGLFLTTGNSLATVPLPALLDDEEQNYLDFASDLRFDAGQFYFLGLSPKSVEVYSLDKNDASLDKMMSRRFGLVRDSAFGFEIYSNAFKAALFEKLPLTRGEKNVWYSNRALGNLSSKDAERKRKYIDYLVSDEYELRREVLDFYRKTSRNVSIEFNSIQFLAFNFVDDDLNALKNIDDLFASYSSLPDSELKRRKEVVRKAFSFLNFSWKIDEELRRTIVRYHETVYKGKKIVVPVTEIGSYNFVPYGWGCFDDVKDFVSKVNSKKYVPGDIYCNDAAGREEVVAGVDCSGFVSRCYGFKVKQSTSTLVGVSKPYPGQDGFDAVKTADILLKKGHVAIYLKKFSNGGIGVIHSSTPLGVNLQKWSQGYARKYAPRYIPSN